MTSDEPDRMTPELWDSIPEWPHIHEGAMRGDSDSVLFLQMSAGAPCLRASQRERARQLLADYGHPTALSFDEVGMLESFGTAIKIGLEQRNQRVVEFLREAAAMADTTREDRATIVRMLNRYGFEL